MLPVNEEWQCNNNNNNNNIIIIIIKTPRYLWLVGQQQIVYNALISFTFYLTYIVKHFCKQFTDDIAQSNTDVRQ